MSPESSPVIVRARRTYGRRATSDYDSSFEAANTSVDSREDPDLSHSTSIDFDHPPTSDPPDASNASPVCEHGSDREEPSEGNTFYKYGWRAQLKEIDERYTEDVGGPSGKPREDTTGASATRPTTPSDLDYAAGDAFGGSLSSLTNSSQPAPSVARSPALYRGNTLPASDYESDHDERPSTPQTSSPNPLGTPRSGSSPTPPTSIEMPPKTGKGKGKALEPLRYDSGDQSPSSSKLSKARDTKAQKKSQGVTKRGKVKPPTKKEVLETKKATVRLTAQQSASIAPAPHKNNYSITKLIARLRPEVPQPIRARSPMPSTDPIEEFSSPRPMPPTPDTKRAEESFVPTGLLGAMNADEDEDEDEDEEMPDFKAIMQQDAKQKEEDARQKQLADFKKRYVEQAPRRATDTPDDDSDIEIVDDMKTVARDEAQARRGAIARGEVPSRGFKKQLAAAGRSARREPALPTTDETELRRTLQAAAKPSFLGGKAEVKLSPGKLNVLLLRKAERQNADIIKANQEEWKRRGGKVKVQPGALESATNPLMSLQDALDKRRSARETQRADSEMVHDSDESDEEWRPDGNQAMDEDGDEDVRDSNAENRVPGPSRDDVDTQADDEDDDENPFRVPCPPQRRARAALVSDDDDNDAENHPPPPTRGRKLVRDSTWVQGSRSPDAGAQSLSHRDSISSLGDLTDGARTEDGTDKENDVSLSFDRGEDKENTVIALQSPAARLGRYGSSLFASEIAASPSGSVGRGATDGVRSPLKELPGEDDDPFAFTPGPPLRLAGPSREGGSFESSPINLGAGNGLEPAFSLSPTGKGKGKARARFTSPSPPDEEAMDLGGGLGGGFGGGGFSQFFTQEGEARGFDQLKAAQDNDDVPLTAEPGLQAALDVSSTWRKKADEIFEKEQEHIAQQEQANAQNEPEPEMFVDANGFLTQTRPSLVSPITRTPFHLHRGVQFSSPGSVLSSVRKPLAPLLSQGPDDDDDTPARPRRLRKRTESPEPPLENAPRLNAFDLLGRSRPLRTKKSNKLDKSEFIEGEAEESDEEAGFGFGPKKAQDDEEDQDGEDQDRILEELVDDKEMDERTLAEEKVLEKVREHQEVDDKAVEKVHLDAIQGKLRAKRGRRGIDLNDSDDSDEDEKAREVRARIKRPKYVSENIKELAKNKDTEAFAQAYSATMADDGEEFAHLRNGDDTMDIDGEGGAEGGGEDEDEEEDEPIRPMAVSAAHLREELLAAAKQEDMGRVFDPDDVSWADRDEEEIELESRVREISAEAPNPPRPNVASGALQAKSNVIDNETPSHLLKWAKTEHATRTGSIIGRNAGSSVAVTGHGKPKGGNGSFKEPRAASSSNAAKPKPVAKQPSMLSSVPSLTKRRKFGN